MNNDFLTDIYKFKNNDSLQKLKIIAPKYLTNNIKYIQVTGTNGKGSVSRLIHAVLWQTLKQKIGLFTSPHIKFINERIVINDKMISNEDLIRIKNLINHDIEYYQLGFFAILTLIALIYFQEQFVQWAILEVGIGGRIDATNVIDATYAIITSIGKDHQTILGNTLMQILNEKMGIIKPNTQMLFVNNNLSHKLKQKIVNQGYKPIYSPKLINKTYAEENKSLALTVITNILPNINFQQALLIMNNTKLTFRLEKYQLNNKTTYFDAAHNLDGIKALIKSCNLMNIMPDQIIFSCLKDKYPLKLIKKLQQLSTNIIICQNSHALSIMGQVFNFETMIKNNLNKIILVTGSCYFLADVYNYL